MDFSSPFSRFHCLNSERGICFVSKINLDFFFAFLNRCDDFSGFYPCYYSSKHCTDFFFQYFFRLKLIFIYSLTLKWWKDELSSYSSFDNLTYLYYMLLWVCPYCERKTQWSCFAHMSIQISIHRTIFIQSI